MPSKRSATAAVSLGMISLLGAFAVLCCCGGCSPCESKPAPAIPQPYLPLRFTETEKGHLMRLAACTEIVLHQELSGPNPGFDPQELTAINDAARWVKGAIK